MAVELADDPRSEFALAAGDDVSVELPRPGEWGADVDDAVDDVEQVADNPEPVAGEVESLPDETELAVAHSNEDLETELARVRVELQQARTELEVERGRREAANPDTSRWTRRPRRSRRARPLPQAVDDEFLDRLEPRQADERRSLLGDG